MFGTGLRAAVLQDDPDHGHHPLSGRGTYYWYMQQVMPGHAGSKRCTSLAHYLRSDAAVKNSAGGTWTSDNSRALVCDSTRSIHPADASVGPGRLQRVRHSLGP